MGINKNFVVRNGLEVSDDLIYADADLNRVGIANTDLIATLSVGGDISAEDAIFSGIVTTTTLDVVEDLEINRNFKVTGISTVSSLNIQNNASIGGGLTVTGFSTFSDIKINGTLNDGYGTGSNGQYLKSTGTGVTWASFQSTSIQTVTQTATESQTTFTGLTYTVGLIDVYLNGVRLSPSEFTATNGTSVTLSDGAFDGDTLDFVIYSTVIDYGNVENYWVKVGSGIHTSGNVGIGTNDPKQKLDVVGNITATGIITATDGFISVGNTTPIKISLVGNKLTFTAVGIGSTTLTLS